MQRNFAGNVGIGGTMLGNEGIAFDPYLSDRDLAKLLNCGRSTIWRYVAKGILPQPIKIGDLTRWRLSAIEAALSQNKADAKSGTSHD